MALIVDKIEVDIRKYMSAPSESMP
jgi:hypothetical protein